MTLPAISPRFGLTRVWESELTPSTADRLMQQLEQPLRGRANVQVERYEDLADPQWGEQTLVFDKDVQLTRIFDKTISDPAKPSTTVSIYTIGPQEKDLADAASQIFKTVLGLKPFRANIPNSSSLPRLIQQSKRYMAGLAKLWGFVPGHIGLAHDEAIAKAVSPFVHVG